MKNTTFNKNMKKTRINRSQSLMQKRLTILEAMSFINNKPVPVERTQKLGIFQAYLNTQAYLSSISEQTSISFKHI
jgi:hypothetical protein